MIIKTFVAFFPVKCEGVAGAANDACIEVILKEIAVEVGKPGIVVVFY